MGAHIVNGQFQSDKYPTCPPGKIPLSVKDKTAQDLLWQYAQRRRAVDAKFADDLEICLRAEGYTPTETAKPEPATERWAIMDTATGEWWDGDRWGAHPYIHFDYADATNSRVFTRDHSQFRHSSCIVPAPVIEKPIAAAPEPNPRTTCETPGCEKLVPIVIKGVPNLCHECICAEDASGDKTRACPERWAIQDISSGEYWDVNQWVPKFTWSYATYADAAKSNAFDLGYRRHSARIVPAPVVETTMSDDAAWEWFHENGFEKLQLRPCKTSTSHRWYVATRGSERIEHCYYGDTPCDAIRAAAKVAVTK